VDICTVMDLETNFRGVLLQLNVGSALNTLTREVLSTPLTNVINFRAMTVMMILDKIPDVF